MKRICTLLFLTFVMCFVHGSLLPQTTTGDMESSDRRGVRRTVSGPLNYYGTASGLNGTINVGNDGLYRYRAVYEWDLPDNVIPDGSTIDSVRLQFTAMPNNHNLPLNFDFVSLPYQISSTADSALYEADGTSIYGGIQTETNYTFDRVWFGSTTPIAQTVSQALAADRLTLRFAYSSELVQTRLWFMRNWTMKLTVWYTPQSTTLHQKLEDGQTEYGKVNLWESTSWHEHNVPTNPFYFPVYSTQTVRADTLFASGTTQKHHDWDDPTKVLNHGDQSIYVGRTTITSKFRTANNATIQAQLVDGGTVGGTVDFKNPWLRDSVDSKGWLSRGANAIWHAVSSGTNNIGTGTLHQGVFLLQGWPNWNPPYYSVGAPNPQTFTIGANNYTAYFQN